jgi:hypothetical protein
LSAHGIDNVMNIVIFAQGFNMRAGRVSLLRRFWRQHASGISFPGDTRSFLPVYRYSLPNPQRRLRKKR